MNPEVLTHVDMTSHTIEAGDMVVIRDDERLLEKFKYMCDDWKDDQMKVCLEYILLHKINGSKFSTANISKLTGSMF